MANPELGVKRRCLACQAAFYDLKRDPIVCVKCGTVFQVIPLPRSPPRRAPVNMARGESFVPAVAAEAETDDDATAGAEPLLDDEEDEKQDDDAAAV